jgi:hypothetical protein
MKSFSRIVNDDNSIRLMVVLSIPAVDYPFCMVRALFAHTQRDQTSRFCWIHRVFSNLTLRRTTFSGLRRTLSLQKTREKTKRTTVNAAGRKPELPA